MIKTIFIVLGLTLTAAASWAQPSYTFQDCVELLKKNNGEWISALQNLESSRYQLRSVYGNYYPQIFANLGYQRGETDQNTAEGYTATLNATENIFRGFSDEAKISDAEGKLKVAEANFRSVSAKLSFDLKSAFANVLYAQESLRLSQNILKRRNDNLNMVQLRFQSGRENKGSVLLSKAYQKQAQLDVVRANNAIQTARYAMIRVLGLAPGTELTVQGDVPQVLPPSAAPDFARLAERTPLFLQYQGQLQSAEAILKGTESSFYPSLDVSGGIGKMGEDFFPDKDRWNVGVTLSWSLFSGGKDYFSRKSAFAQKLVTENSWRNAQLDSVFQLSQAYAAYVESIEQLKVSDAFVDAGSVRAEIGRSQYNNGLTTFDEWDRIENDLISYQKDQTSKRRDRIVAEATWDQVQGAGVLP